MDELLRDIGGEADGVYQTEGVYFAIRDGQIYEISDDASCAPHGGWFPTLVRGLPEEVTPWDEEEEDLYQIIVYPPHEIYEAVE